MSSEYCEWQVLIVDNSPTMGRMIKNQMVALGLKPENITLARDGNQAFMITELKEFDLVSSAMHLKFKSGLEFLRALRRSDQESMNGVLFLMISSDASAQFQADLMSDGANGFLKKPFTADGLKEMLRRLSEGKAGEFVQLAGNESKKEVRESENKEADHGVASGVVDAFVESTLESLGQYMVNAVPGECQNGIPVDGDLHSWIDITDTNIGVKIRIQLAFPKKIACSIYQNLFGEVDLDMVCGIVGELGNIIAGSVKPRLEGWGGSLHQLVAPESKPIGNDIDLDLQLGFPESHWKGDGELPAADGTAAFTVPFNLDDENILLQVQFYPA